MASMLVGCEVEPLEQDAARRSGELLATGSSTVEAVDATVVESAMRRGHTVVTSNRSHLLALAEGAKRRLSLIAL